ncbi:MAG: HlyC/CorC family transporter [Polyangiaceae bacterium]|nr:HlyC/CorC family transporter [Polyangiaceae bacterium]
MLTVLIIALLVLLNGIFVAAEFAIIGVPRSSIERRAAEGSTRAKAVLAILRDPTKQDQYIATAQLGITFASLGLGMYGEHAVAVAIAPYLERIGLGHWISVHGVASVLAIGLCTYVHIVIGEMVPKALALGRAEQSVLLLSTPMRWFKALMYLFVVSLNKLGALLLRAVGVRRQGGLRHHTAAELRFIVEESVEQGELEEEAGDVLIELFEFGTRTAVEVMVPRVRVTGIPLGASPDVLRERLQGKQHTRYPVYKEGLDEIVGMVLIRDLLAALHEGARLSEDRVRPVPFLPETARLGTVLSMMRREKTQLAVVMDEHGGTAGIITMEDLFEEVVGEIDDGRSGPDPVVVVEGGLRALGIARLDEVGDEADADLSHPEVDTVSGLILALLNRPAEVGDAVSYQGFRFVVLSVDGLGVAEAQVTPLEAAEVSHSEPPPSS